jgi:hypothetical protein
MKREDLACGFDGQSVSNPQHCMPCKIPVGKGYSPILFRDLFLLLQNLPDKFKVFQIESWVINFHKRVTHSRLVTSHNKGSLSLPPNSLKSASSIENCVVCVMSCVLQFRNFRSLLPVPPPHASFPFSLPHSPSLHPTSLTSQILLGRAHSV